MTSSGDAKEQLQSSAPVQIRSSGEITRSCKPTDLQLKKQHCILKPVDTFEKGKVTSLCTKSVMIFKKMTTQISEG